ncbi:hypothetical protein HMPREF9081_1898 [Centipeda periodontii DSM 2778]|uniref:Uncharacterized protein n=1 Tax=Centipeda periodontii DSM 2778 TaxID=888060 RepID=F5RNS7_9FIRM|nr:hypothetical protein HMPREF9081_1898 [Centipeda periodontii DSM 2778]
MHRRFNPRAPCGARPLQKEGLVVVTEFQSTRPVRGATGGSVPAGVAMAFQSTRPVRGATMLFAMIPPPHSFQSTRPVRGATRLCDKRGDGDFVSIHAPRAGRD